MGGLVCIHIVRSTLSFTSVPTEASEIILFDNQVRKIHYNTEYAQSVINETPYGKELGELLGIPSSKWTHANRQMFLDAVNIVCGGYT
jgi:hypothetical protein